MTDLTPEQIADISWSGAPGPKSPVYRAGFNAGIDCARKFLKERCVYAFDEWLAKEKLPEPKS